MASPSMTLNQTAIANQATLAASGNVNTGADALDLRAKFEGQFQVYVTFGSTSATSGLQVDVLRAVDAATGSTFDTVPVATMVIPSAPSTSKVKSFTLGPGLYQVSLTNLDGTNSVTNVKCIYSTVDGVA